MWDVELDDSAGLGEKNVYGADAKLGAVRRQRHAALNDSLDVSLVS